jgi:hypothetical protein
MPTTPKLDKLRRDLLKPWKLKLFMLAKLPMGFLAGLKVTECTERAAAVTIRFGYLTKNPFRSMYFACLAMAAELSTGVLGLLPTLAGSPVAMLIVGLEGEFTKKAVGLITFRCEDGEAVKQAIAETRATGEPRVVPCTTTGRDETGDVVATFKFTWSFKARGASVP